MRRAHIALCLAGIAVAVYSIYVESMLVGFPGYTPSCDISSWQMSCSNVFRSPYSRILSHFGLVAAGSGLDFSLPQLAIAYFTLMIILSRSHGNRPALLMRVLSYAAIAFNLYLAYVLKFILGEVCIVCVTNYLVNLGIFLTVHRLTRAKKNKHI
jgi:uncharacterized membrane protein